MIFRQGIDQWADMEAWRIERIGLILGTLRTAGVLFEETSPRVLEGERPHFLEGHELHFLATNDVLELHVAVGAIKVGQGRDELYYPTIAIYLCPGYDPSNGGWGRQNRAGLMNILFKSPGNSPLTMHHCTWQGVPSEAKDTGNPLGLETINFLNGSGGFGLHLDSVTNLAKIFLKEGAEQRL